MGKGDGHRLWTSKIMRLFFNQIDYPHQNNIEKRWEINKKAMEKKDIHIKFNTHVSTVDTAFKDDVKHIRYCCYKFPFHAKTWNWHKAKPTTIFPEGVFMKPWVEAGAIKYCPNCGKDIRNIILQEQEFKIIINP